MASKFERTIRSRLTAYVTGKVVWNKFWEWLASVAWDIEKYNDQSAEDLLYSIMLLVSEYDAGHRTRADLDAELRKLISYKLGSPNVTIADSGVSSSFEVPYVEYSLASVDTVPAGVFGSPAQYSRKHQTSGVQILSAACEAVF